MQQAASSWSLTILLYSLSSPLLAVQILTWAQCWLFSECTGRRTGGAWRTRRGLLWCKTPEKSDYFFLLTCKAHSKVYTISNHKELESLQELQPCIPHLRHHQSSRATEAMKEYHEVLSRQRDSWKACTSPTCCHPWIGGSSHRFWMCEKYVILLLDDRHVLECHIE
jgi:hypothetical protein